MNAKKKPFLVNEKEDIIFETFGERLSHLMKSCGLTPSAIQKSFQIPEATIRSWMTSNKTIRIENIEKLIKIFENKSIHIDINWLIHGKEESFAVLNKNNHPFEIASDNILMIEEAQNYRSLYQDSITHRIGSNINHFKENDIVGGRLLDKPLWIKSIGRYCICEKNLESGLFLSIPYNNEKSIYFLDLYLNTLHPSDEIKSCFPVVWHRTHDVERS